MMWEMESKMNDDYVIVERLECGKICHVDSQIVWNVARKLRCSDKAEGRGWLVLSPFPCSSPSLSSWLFIVVRMCSSPSCWTNLLNVRLYAVELFHMCWCRGNNALHILSTTSYVLLNTLSCKSLSRTCFTSILEDDHRVNTARGAMEMARQITKDCQGDRKSVV